MDSLLQRVIIIGEILSFRELLHSALHDVLECRLPFLLSIVHNLHETTNDHNKLVCFYYYTYIIFHFLNEYLYLFAKMVN